jgi:UDP-N-acetylmuramate--alanine ligase
MTTHVHLIGIGGTGLSAIARVLRESGYEVSGSDRVLSHLAHNLQLDGVRIEIGHRAENVAGADLVVRSSAIPDNNPEVQAALAAGIPVLKRYDFLGSLMAGRKGIAIAGTHGKTTTTAMIAWMLTALGEDPSYIVGSVVKNMESNAHAGKSAYFVIEADEYDHMFLGLQPELIVVTNMEHDHPDCFPTPQDYQQAFQEFVRRLKPGGRLLACSDDPGAAGLKQFAQDLGYSALSYGFNEPADYLAADLAVNARGGFSCEVSCRDPEGMYSTLARLDLQVPGEHNVRNALAALGVAHLLGLPMEKAARALNDYQGSSRRFEVRGEVRGITIVDDYAHHPTEIKTTLAGARLRYPGRRLWAVWQPHTYSRTLALLDQFEAAFTDADQVVVTEVYPAREPVQAFSARQVVEAMRHPAAHFVAGLDQAVSFLLNQVRPGDVVLVFSAGDADQISTGLLAFLSKR